MTRSDQSHRQTATQRTDAIISEVPAAAIDVRGDIDPFIELIGEHTWSRRLGEILQRAATGRRAGRAILQRHAIELTIRRVSRGDHVKSGPTPAELRIAALCRIAVDAAASLPVAGLERMRAALSRGLEGNASLVPFFHILHTAALQQERGFDVRFSGWADATTYDLVITGPAEPGRESSREAAEIACEMISAEAGRDVHRGAWFRLVDRVDPELQTWLAAHPGRYVLKMTLPQGLKDAADASEAAGVDPLAALHTRISALLQAQRRSDFDEAAMLRLDPLMLVASQADELGLMPRLRSEFGPEAHLAVTTGGNGLFVMAARAGREDTVAAVVRERMTHIAPLRLSGTRPGILAMFIEDTDRTEWHGLRDRMELEGEARQFLTQPQAKHVVAVTCACRLELFGTETHGDIRFRNQAHPAAKSPVLNPAIASTI
jgi:hypothetical protein